MGKYNFKSKHREDEKVLKLNIILNFINYYTSSDEEREDMYHEAETYVDEDWVDEITQAGYVNPKKL